MASSNPRHTVQWQRLRSQVVAAARANGDPCAICHRPIDYDLSGRHPWGPTVEHTASVAEHPDLAFEPTLLRIAHRRCNLRAGASLGGKRRAAIRAAANGGQPPPPRRSLTADRW